MDALDLEMVVYEEESGLQIQRKELRCRRIVFTNTGYHMWPA